MSQATEQTDERDWLFVCEYCGMPVYSPDDDCAALDDGRCVP